MDKGMQSEKPAKEHEKDGGKSLLLKREKSEENFFMSEGYLVLHMKMIQYTAVAIRKE